MTALMASTTFRLTFLSLPIFRSLRTIHKKPENGLQACLHVYTGYQIRQSFHLQENGQVVQDSVGDWESFWNPLEALLIREYEATLKL
jgi:hypothetical protein